MVSAGLPQKMADAIVTMGYDSPDVFRSAFVDKSAFETWLSKSREKLGDEAKAIDASDWTTCPLAAKLRLFLSSLQPPSPPESLGAITAKESSLALLPLAGSTSKVSASDRDAWRRQIEKDYPSAVVTPETLPSLGFLQLVRQQCVGKQWEWLPWKRVLSEEQALEVRGRKNASGHGELLDLFAAAAGIQHEEWDMDLGASALRVQNLLDTRAHAYVMCGSGHLHSWSVYTKRFLHFYTKKPAEHFRPPSIQEAEAADRAIMNEVFQLAFAGNKLDDALHHVVVERDMPRLLLIERPKVPKATWQRWLLLGQGGPAACVCAAKTPASA